MEKTLLIAKIKNLFGHPKQFLTRVIQSAIFFGMLASVFRVGANLIILPIALLKLSNEEMVVWWAFLALGAASQLSDFGFSPVITRAYSFLWAGASEYLKKGLPPPTAAKEPNYAELAVLHSSVVKLYRTLALLFTILMLGFGGWYLKAGPMKHIEDPHLLWMAWILYALTMGWNLKMSYWEQAANGLNHVRAVQISNVAGGVGYVIVGVCLLHLDLGLMALSVAAAARALLTRMICRMACKDQFRISADKEKERAMLGKLWSNAWKFGIMTVGGYLLTSGVLLVGLKSLPPESAQPAGLTFQFGRFIFSIAALWLQVKLPHLAMQRTKGHVTEMSVLFAQRLCISLLSLFIMSLGLVLFGDFGLEFIGTDKRLLVTPYLLFYTMFLIWRLGYSHFGLLVFTENVIPFHWIGFTTGVAALGLAIWLVPIYGVWGLLFSSAIAEASFSGWFTYWRGFRSQNLSVSKFIKAMCFMEGPA